MSIHLDYDLELLTPRRLAAPTRQVAQANCPR